MKIIIPLGGRGNRLYPATKCVSKEFLTIVDRPLIDYAIREILNSGFKFEEMIFVAGKNKTAIKKYFEPEKIKIASQPNPIGNGDAVLRTLPFIGENPVAILFSDEVLISKIPVLIQLKKWFEKLQAPVLALIKVPKNKTSNYGVVRIIKTKLHPNLYQITEITEKPKTGKAPTNLTLLGRHIITLDIFKELKKLKPQKNKEMTINDALNNYMKKGGAVFGYEYEGERFDCGSKIGLLKVQVRFGLTHPETKKSFKPYLNEINNQGRKSK